MVERSRREELFRQVMAEHASGLWRLAAGYIWTSTEREDLGQGVLLALWKALPAFREESSFRTFVYRIGHTGASAIGGARHAAPSRSPSMA